MCRECVFEEPFVSTSETLFDIEGPIAFLTFNRPEARNAMTWGMYDALVAACDRVDADPNLRVFVLRGAGARIRRRHRHQPVLAVHVERRCDSVRAAAGWNYRPRSNG